MKLLFLYFLSLFSIIKSLDNTPPFNEFNIDSIKNINQNEENEEEINNLNLNNQEILNIINHVILDLLPYHQRSRLITFVIQGIINLLPNSIRNQVINEIYMENFFYFFSSEIQYQIRLISARLWLEILIFNEEYMHPSSVSFLEMQSMLNNLPLPLEEELIWNQDRIIVFFSNFINYRFINQQENAELNEETVYCSPDYYLNNQ
jgi:hypothetical protein